MTRSETRALAVELTGERRRAHILGAAEEAEKLARRWGADPERAYIAGLLHDLTKYRDLPEQLKLCKRYGIIPSPVDIACPASLHGMTGAELARERFGADAEIASAIRSHTFGNEAMTRLDKVLFLADYIEPTRQFDGVDDMRALAYRDIDAACLQKTDRTILRVVSLGRVLHPGMVAARNALIAKAAEPAGGRAP